jgi:hypothetical protein
MRGLASPTMTLNVANSRGHANKRQTPVRAESGKANPWRSDCLRRPDHRRPHHIRYTTFRLYRSKLSRKFFVHMGRTQRKRPYIRALCSTTMWGKRQKRARKCPYGRSALNHNVGEQKTKTRRVAFPRPSARDTGLAKGRLAKTTHGERRRGASAASKARLSTSGARPPDKPRPPTSCTAARPSRKKRRNRLNSPPQRQEEAGLAGDPARAVGRQAAAGNDDVDMGMMGSAPSPRCAARRRGRCALVLGVCRGGGLEQRVVDEGPVGERQGADRGGSVKTT